MVCYSGKKKNKHWGKAVAIDKEENKNLSKSEQQCKVLIVEDNAFNIVPIKSTLEKNKIQFDIAKNGSMAVERYKNIMKEGYMNYVHWFSNIYGVILMDLEMPVMDGYEATEKIRESEKANKYPSTYICALSASTEEGFIYY